MPPYELEIAISLNVFAAVSAVLLHLHKREGNISLPLHDDGCPDKNVDPFEIITPEDHLDGYPIQEERFWAQMRSRKIILSAVAFLLVLLHAFRLAFELGFGADHTFVHAWSLSFSLYLFLIATLSIRRQSATLHTESVWHLTTLSFVGSLLSGISLFLPASSDTQEVRSPFPITVLFLLFATFLVAINTPCGPDLHFPPSAIYSGKIVEGITKQEQHNVSGVYGASPWSTLFFSYSTKVVMLGNSTTSAQASRLEIGDLPILTASMRATNNYESMRRVMSSGLISASWGPRVGSGLHLASQVVRVNSALIVALLIFAVIDAAVYYLPPFFMRQVLQYLEADPDRERVHWGVFWVTCLLGSDFLVFIGQLWSVCTATLQPRIRTQLNTVLFDKTLRKKDAVSSSTPENSDSNAEESAMRSKAQVMTLMTTDVDRVASLADHIFTFVDAPIEIAIATAFLYNLLGVSCLFGFGAVLLFLPLNHFAGTSVSKYQSNLMKSRDERMGLMNEVLGAIRMLKYMGWEPSFMERIMKIRLDELKYQRLSFILQTLLTGLWALMPILVTLVSFYHFAVVRGETLTPSIAFTSVLFNALRFALSSIPQTIITFLQSLVSLKRIEKYLFDTSEVDLGVASAVARDIAFHGCDVTWPQQEKASDLNFSTTINIFKLLNLSLKFPRHELSLVCGKLGSGKTLLGEADILRGRIVFSRSPVNALAPSLVPIKEEDWIVEGFVAYVPQIAWLQNASIRENILFNLPYVAARYKRTLEVCALVSDLRILEDGDESEIGERGVNLSGGQKARVSLARAVYSRASVLLLDDVLSAVDAHTARHLYHSCLKGVLMAGRTVILVSHHVQLCVPGAGYVVALDNGQVKFQGSGMDFERSEAMRGLVHSSAAQMQAVNEEHTVESIVQQTLDDTSITARPTSEVGRKPPRRLIQDEGRAIGRVALPVWKMYIHAGGYIGYWIVFVSVFVAAALVPVLENGWLSYWSRDGGSNESIFYISVYAAASLLFTLVRLFVLFHGSIHASTILYQNLLETVLFAPVRFHDTVSRGRVLNRFGKDFEGIDSILPINFARTTIFFLSSTMAILIMSVIGGLPFVVGVCFLSFFYYQSMQSASVLLLCLISPSSSVAKASVYRPHFIGIWSSRLVVSPEFRLKLIFFQTRSPLYTMYSETIAGVTVIRAFGASSKFLRDMLRAVDTNCNPAYWVWGVNRWLSIRMACMSSITAAFLALLAVYNRNIPAALAGVALAFSNTVCRRKCQEILLTIREFVSLEQAMVGLERVKEYSDLKREPAEIIEPRPDPSWPLYGSIRCENLDVRYAPDLPNVLHDLNLEIKPGEKIGILGRTGSGKSTLALAFFRFVEAHRGRILIDGLDISKLGLTDLRSRLTIIPQDPTILSGTIRTTLDVFGEYQDSAIFEALRRVHLLPSVDTSEGLDNVNPNLFRNLESPVSEGGDNFSTGEKQLFCMARAILKRSKILLMDEFCSVDYATDELISKTIREEFEGSTVLCIAHRLRTVIGYDRVMLLDQGKIVEFDRPSVLLSNTSSKFYALCEATGNQEFETLKRMAQIEN
ncbi:ATP-dependent bile acid permease [Favolaschia claudopus]|uniref:ATP-dependent bile acid permease n=1 Tax=Favolaschia claudopus TaxID=2862362 RepID=A0AAW0A3F3_9AGAR